MLAETENPPPSTPPTPCGRPAQVHAARGYMAVSARAHGSAKAQRRAFHLAANRMRSGRSREISRLGSKEHLLGSGPGDPRRTCTRSVRYQSTSRAVPFEPRRDLTATSARLTAPPPPPPLPAPRGLKQSRPRLLAEPPAAVRAAPLLRLQVRQLRCGAAHALTRAGSAAGGSGGGGGGRGGAADAVAQGGGGGGAQRASAAMTARLRRRSARDSGDRSAPAAPRPANYHAGGPRIVTRAGRELSRGRAANGHAGGPRMVTRAGRGWSRGRAANGHAGGPRMVTRAGREWSRGRAANGHAGGPTRAGREWSRGRA